MAKSQLEYLIESINAHAKATKDIPKWRSRKQFADGRERTAENDQRHHKHNIVSYLRSMGGSIIYEGKVYTAIGQYDFSITEVKYVSGSEPKIVDGSTSAG